MGDELLRMFFQGRAGLLRTLVVGVLAYSALVLVLRVSGKRTLSKMNAFDFVVTVALGSTLATVLLSKDVALAEGVAAFALLVGMQFVITWASVRSKGVSRLVKSEPKMLLYRGEFLRGAMRRERVTEEEVLAAVRSRGVAAIGEVEAVVLETDGSFSVVQSAGGARRGFVARRRRARGLRGRARGSRRKRKAAAGDLPLTSKSTQEEAETLKPDGWLTRERVLALALLAATVLAAYVCYLWPARSCPRSRGRWRWRSSRNPLYEWVARRVRRPNLAAGLAVAAVAVVIIAPTVFVTQRLVREAVGSAQAVVSEVESGRWREAVAGKPRLAQALSWVEGQVSVDEELRRLAGAATARLSAYVTGSIWAVVQLLVTLFALFYFFRDRAAVLGKLRSARAALRAGDGQGVLARRGDNLRHRLRHARRGGRAGVLRRADVLVAGAARPAAVGRRDGASVGHPRARRVRRLGARGTVPSDCKGVGSRRSYSPAGGRPSSA